MIWWCIKISWKLMTPEMRGHVCASKVIWQVQKGEFWRDCKSKKKHRYSYECLDFEWQKQSRKICYLDDWEVRDTDSFGLELKAQKTSRRFLSISWLCIPMSWLNSQTGLPHPVAKLLNAVCSKLTFHPTGKLREKIKHLFPNRLSQRLKTEPSIGLIWL